MKNNLLSIYNFFLEPYCLLCKEIAQQNTGFCGDCWKKVKFVSEPLCICCGAILQYEIDGKSYLCGLCIKSKPIYNQAKYLFTYNNDNKNLLFQIKYGKNLNIIEILSKIMVNRYSDFINQNDIITYIPMHFIKWISRKFFNHAFQIANFISFLAQKPIIKLLSKSRYTKSQTLLTSKQRLVNLKNSFIVNSSYQNFIKDKKILLIDDVITTGSTINECSALLKKYGAKEVNILAIAKNNGKSLTLISSQNNSLTLICSYIKNITFTHNLKPINHGR